MIWGPLSPRAWCYITTTQRHAPSLAQRVIGQQWSTMSLSKIRSNSSTQVQLLSPLLSLESPLLRVFKPWVKSPPSGLLWRSWWRAQHVTVVCSADATSLCCLAPPGLWLHICGWPWVWFHILALPWALSWGLSTSPKDYKQGAVQQQISK